MDAAEIEKNKYREFIYMGGTTPSSITWWGHPEMKNRYVEKDVLVVTEFKPDMYPCCQKPAFVNHQNW